MKVLNPGISLEAFWQRLPVAEGRVLFLDYDGTLAPFQTERHKAFPYPGVRDLLNELQAAKHTRLVIVSGRSTQDLQPLLGLAILPEIWGCHGLERLMPDGSYVTSPLEAGARKLIQRAASWLDDTGLSAQKEQKPGSLAIHWRGSGPDKATEIKTRVRETWESEARANDIDLKEFDGGIEFRVAGMNKGTAVRTVLDELGTDAAGAYLGDDLTDEDAFAEMKGEGIGCLVRQDFRETGADIWLIPPLELLAFLSRWHSTCKKE